MRRTWLKIVLAAAVLFLLAIILVPLFVNGAALRPRVEALLTAALGRSVTLGSLSFSLLHGSLVAKDISIADDPAYSTAPFLQASQLNVGVEVRPLLFHHEINITSLAIDQPSVVLIQSASGKWNFSSIGGAQTKSTQLRPTLTVAELEIKDGSVNIATLPPKARPAASPAVTTGQSSASSPVTPGSNPFAYSGVDLTIKDFSFAAVFPFDLSATLPANGTLKLTGTAGPIAPSADETPFQSTVRVSHFDPVAAGLIERSAGISAVVDLDGQVHSDGTTLSSSGHLTADHLQLARAGSPSPEPVKIDFDVTTNLATRAGKISGVTVHAGSAAAHATGSYTLTPTTAIVDLRLAAPAMPINSLEKLLPVVGIRLPSGSQLRGGTLSANVSVTGPATAATISGPVEVADTTLEGFELGSRIQGLNPFGAHTGGTQIKSLRATIHSTPQLTRVENLDADLPQLGSATGSGTVSPSGDLDFKLVATLSTSNLATAIPGLATQAIGRARGVVGSVFHPHTILTAATTNKGIPVTVTGTPNNPVIRANVAGLVR